MLSNHLILCYPLLLLPSIFPSIRVFSNESALHIRWPKYWSFSFSISPSNEYSGLISFRINWLDLLAVQGTFKSSPTPQFKSINSSVLSFLYSPSLTSIHDYWKTIALTRRTFVGKVISLLFIMLSRLIIAFLPRSKRLLISWLQSPSAVILEPKIIVCHCFHCFPICIEVIGPYAVILSPLYSDYLFSQHTLSELSHWELPTLKEREVKVHFIANRWENSGNTDRLYFGGSKILQMVTAAMKLKDGCSLEEKLWPT